MTAGARASIAALALVGAPFRLHGRDPATGIDCVGLVARAMSAAGLRVSDPVGYALRNSAIDDLLHVADRCDLVPAHDQLLPGDILLVGPGPAQQHLLVAAPGGSFVHAHAGLRRVVRMPGPLTWPTLRHWRPHEKV